MRQITADYFHTDSMTPQLLSTDTNQTIIIAELISSRRINIQITWIHKIVYNWRI